MRIEMSALALQLARGTTARLAGARGARLRVLSGRLWLTEEQLVDDIFLRPGCDYTLRGDGLTVIEADETATIELAGCGMRWPIAYAMPLRPARVSALRRSWQALRRRRRRMRDAAAGRTPSALIA